MDISPYIHTVCNRHPEFTYDEVQEVCETYLATHFDKKTKEDTKHKSLKKYLTKEFSINFDDEENISSSTYSLSSLYTFPSLPKSLFQSRSAKQPDYILSVQDLTKQIGTTVLFADTDFHVRPGDKIAIIGKNGAGKSTLLKIILQHYLTVPSPEEEGRGEVKQIPGELHIAIEGINDSLRAQLLDNHGTYDQTTGTITIAKGVRIGFLSQDLFRHSKDRVVLDEMLTSLPDITRTMQRLEEIDILVANNDPNAAYLLDEQHDLINWMVSHDGYNRYTLQKTILTQFGFSDHQLEMQISQLSGGEQTKVQIAKFLIQDVDLLILDEPTNHLDISGIMFLEKFCQARGKTLLCISHDKEFLNTTFTKTLEIAQQKLTMYNANYDGYLTQKQAIYDRQVQAYTTQQKYLEQQNRFVERFRYKASKASAVQSRIKMLDKLDKIELPENDTQVGHITLRLTDRLPNLIMELKNLEVGYKSKNITPAPSPQERGDHMRESPSPNERNLGGGLSLISLPSRLEITKDMHIGIIGKNGIGKTTLLKTILGELPALMGSVYVNEKIKIGSYSQVAADLDYSKTILDELVGPGVSNKEVRSILGSLLIANEKMEQKIGTLSGGERAKVALTKMLLSKPHVVIMDEPTNHLDIPSKDVIKTMLADFAGVTLIVSHDRDFLYGTSNLLRVIKDKKLTVFHNLDRGFTLYASAACCEGAEQAR